LFYHRFHDLASRRLAVQSSAHHLNTKDIHWYLDRHRRGCAFSI